jgi:hypothetical protein
MTNGTRREWEASVTPRPLFTPGKDQAPILQEAGWAPGPVWTGAKNLAPTGIRSPNRPARSQSLYRLRYPACIEYITFITCLHFRLFCRPKSLTWFKESDNGIILLPFGGTEDKHQSFHLVDGGVFIDFDRTLVVRRTTQLEQRVITTGQVVRL